MPALGLGAKGPLADHPLYGEMSPACHLPLTVVAGWLSRSPGGTNCLGLPKCLDWCDAAGELGDKSRRYRSAAEVSQLLSPAMGLLALLHCCRWTSQGRVGLMLLQLVGYCRPPLIDHPRPFPAG